MTGPQILDKLGRSRGEDPIASGLAVARAAQRVGELEVAEATLAELFGRYPGQAEVAGTYARLLIAAGRNEEAREVAMAGPLVGMRAEAAGLAAFHLGELEAADAAFAALAVDAAATGHAASAGQAVLLRGLVAHRRGQLGLASERYREAARRLGEAGAKHGAATAELELGAVLVERGRGSEALPALASAARSFGELGSQEEAATAELHRASALMAVGQLDGALVAAEAALAGSAGALRARALIAAGEVKRRLGDEPAALACLREALAMATLREDARGQLRAQVALAEAGQRDGDGVAVEALCRSDEDRDVWTLARGRLALRDVASGAAEATAALAKACAEAAARAGEADRLDRAFRGHAIAAQLASRAREPALAKREAEHARLSHAAIAAATAPGLRAAVDGDPDLARLPGALAASAGDDVLPARPAPGEERATLRRLLAIARRLGTASLDRIFEEVIEAAIELTGAERGFVLLRVGDGLQVAVARNFVAEELGERAEDDASRRPPSRAIAERVAQTGETVMTVDAAVSPRPGAPALAAALQLRSVLVVPLRQRGTIIGSLYVDHRVRSQAFDAAAANVLGELADLAAIAIANAQRMIALEAAAEARQTPEVPFVGEDLRLKPALAAVEETYLAAAMARAHGNQTAAARLLGLSRFGLQKKLRRRAGDDD